MRIMNKHQKSAGKECPGILQNLPKKYRGERHPQRTSVFKGQQTPENILSSWKLKLFKSNVILKKIRTYKLKV